MWLLIDTSLLRTAHKLSLGKLVSLRYFRLTFLWKTVYWTTFRRWFDCWESTGQLTDFLIFFRLSSTLSNPPMTDPSVLQGLRFPNKDLVSLSCGFYAVHWSYKRWRGKKVLPVDFYTTDGGSPWLGRLYPGQVKPFTNQIVLVLCSRTVVVFGSPPSVLNWTK